MNTLISAISGSNILESVILLIVFAVIFGLLFWLLDFVGKKWPVVMPFIPVAHIILAIAAVILCINVLLTLVGKPLIKW